MKIKKKQTGIICRISIQQNTTRMMGLVETKFEINEEDLPEIIEYYLRDHVEFDFDEIDIVNNRPMNIWLYAKLRKYVDPDDPDSKDLDNAEVEVKGEYDDNPTG